MRWPSLLLLVAMTACGASAGVGSNVRAVSAPAATFSEYRTFAIAVQPAAGPGARPSFIERRTRTLIAARLILKGYVEQTGGGRPDFLVAFDPRQGALVVSAFDARTDSQVWRADSEADRDPGPQPACVDDFQLRDDVGRLMASFPSRSDETGQAEVSALTW